LVKDELYQTVEEYWQSSEEVEELS